MRAELTRIVEASPEWDGKTHALVVTDLTERTVQLRATVSAANGGSLWTLRCQVREKLLAWLQAQGRASLPTLRVETGSLPERGR